MRTGRQYLDSLEDGRSVYLSGKRVDSVVRESPFRHVASTVARLIDEHGKPGSGLLRSDGESFAPVWCSVPTSSSELVAIGAASHSLAAHTLGIMGRLFDSSGSIISGLYNLCGDVEAIDAGGAAAIRALYRRCRDDLLLVNVAFVDPPGSRSASNVAARALRIVERDRRGIVVSGAKSLCTGASYSDEILVLTTSPEMERKDPAEVLGFTVRPSVPGISIMCGHGRRDLGDDSIVRSLAEIDSWLVFENVFVPWQDVLYSANARLAGLMWAGVVAWDKHCFVRRIVCRIEVLFGLVYLMCRALGVGHFPAAQKIFYELGREHALLSRLVEYAEQHPVIAPGSGGALRPEIVALGLALGHAHERVPQLMQSIELLGGQGIVLIPDESDLESQLGEHYARHFLSSVGDVRSRARLMRLAAELVASRHAARQRLLDYYALGHAQANVAQLTSLFDATRGVRMVEQFLRK